MLVRYGQATEPPRIRHREWRKMPALAVGVRRGRPITPELRRNGAPMIAAFAAVVTLAWTYLLRGAHIGTPMIGLGGDQTTAISSQWSLGHAALVFVMWAVMMVAMMLPSVTKIVLLVGTLDGQETSLLALRSIAEFVAGYLAVWLGFGLAATALQWTLDDAGLLSVTLATSDHILAGSLLLHRCL